MKFLLKLLLLGFVFTLPAAASPPLASTGRATNVFSTTATLMGTVNANNESAYAWFEWGVSPSLGNVNAVGNIGSGDGEVTVAVQIGGLAGAAVYHFRVACSNDSGRVYGETGSFTTRASSFLFTGTGWESVDPTRPLGSELVRVADDAIRQTRAAGISATTQEHDIRGYHKPGFLQTPMIADDAVTEQKLSSAVRIKLNDIGGTNAAYTIMVTNALTYITSAESEGANVNTTAAGQTLGTISLASNSFSKVMITAEIQLHNMSDNPRTWNYVRINLNGVSAIPDRPQRLNTRSTLLVSRSVIVAGGNASAVSVTITTQSDNSNDNGNIQATLLNVRLWGLP